MTTSKIYDLYSSLIFSKFKNSLFFTTSLFTSRTLFHNIIRYYKCLYRCQIIFFLRLLTTCDELNNLKVTVRKLFTRRYKVNLSRIFHNFCKKICVISKMRAKVQSFIVIINNLNVLITDNTNSSFYHSRLKLYKNFFAYKTKPRSKNKKRQRRRLRKTRRKKSSP